MDVQRASQPSPCSTNPPGIGTSNSSVTTIGTWVLRNHASSLDRPTSMARTVSTSAPGKLVSRSERAVRCTTASSASAFVDSGKLWHYQNSIAVKDLSSSADRSSAAAGCRSAGRSSSSEPSSHAAAVLRSAALFEGAAGLVGSATNVALGDDRAAEVAVDVDQVALLVVRSIRECGRRHRVDVLHEQTKFEREQGEAV